MGERLLEGKKTPSDVAVRKYRWDQVLPAHVCCLIELWPFTGYRLYLMPHYLPLHASDLILFQRCQQNAIM